jgi:hypothetical protein
MCSRPTDSRTSPGVTPAVSCLLGRQLRVGGGCRVNKSGFRTSPMLATWTVELDSVDKLPTGFHTTLDFKRQHRSGAPRGVFLGVGVGRVRRETGIVDTRDLGVCFQPLGHFLGRCRSGAPSEATGFRCPGARQTRYRERPQLPYRATVARGL